MHLLVALLALSAPAEASDVGPLVRALWLVQRYGTADAVLPANDQRLKGVLSKALAKDGVITLPELGGLMEPDAFKKLAGSDATLDSAEINRVLEAATPESRRELLPQVREHADYLTTSFDMIDEPHKLAGEKLASWLIENYRPGKPLHVVVICTGNSRRSIIGSTLGNIAAAYYGCPEIHFHSGGTAPTAFNPRTIATLQAIGVQIEPTGEEAKRGGPETANPTYRVRWGSSESDQRHEVSKLYSDPANPQSGFAALMVCGEADAGCPFVKGAALRVSMPYLDPKVFDGGAYESAKYAERRDDMGRLMLSVLMQVRNRLGTGGTATQ